MFKSRIACRIAFIAEGLTTGLNPENSVLSRKRRTRRGRKQYPRNSNMTLAYLPVRCPSLCSKQSWFSSDAFPGGREFDAPSINQTYWRSVSDTSPELYRILPRPQYPQATCGPADDQFQPRVAFSASERCTRPLIWALRMQFSATRYSFRKNNSWSTVPLI